MEGRSHHVNFSLVPRPRVRHFSLPTAAWKRCYINVCLQDREKDWAGSRMWSNTQRNSKRSKDLIQLHQSASSLIMNILDYSKEESNSKFWLNLYNFWVLVPIPYSRVLEKLGTRLWCLVTHRSTEGRPGNEAMLMLVDRGKAWEWGHVNVGPQREGLGMRPC